MEDPLWGSVSEDPNFDLRLENQLRIPTEWSAARRKPRFERTEGSLSAMLADSQAAFLCRDVLQPGPAFIDPSQEGRAPPPSPGAAPLFPSCLDIVQDRFPANALNQSD